MSDVGFWQNAFALAASATVIMGSPGPTNLSAAAVGAAFGVRKSIAYVLGLIVGTITVLLMVSAGLVALVFALPAGAIVLRTASAAYIVYLAWKVATAPALAEDAEGTTAPEFGGGFLLGVANPKAYFAIGAVLAGVTLIPADAGLDAVAKIAFLSCMIGLFLAVWLLAGVALANALKDPFISRLTNIVMALALLGTGVFALLGS